MTALPFWAILGQMVRQPCYRSHLPHWQMGNGPSERVQFAAKVDPENYKQEAI